MARQIIVRTNKLEWFNRSPQGLRWGEHNCYLMLSRLQAFALGLLRSYISVASNFCIFHVFLLSFEFFGVQWPRSFYLSKLLGLLGPRLLSFDLLSSRHKACQAIGVVALGLLDKGVFALEFLDFGNWKGASLADSILTRWRDQPASFLFLQVRTHLN